jgi:hypothetical protein
MDLTVNFQTQQNFTNFLLTNLFHIKQLEYVTTSAEIPFVILETFHKFNFPLQVGASKFHILCFIPLGGVFCWQRTLTLDGITNGQHCYITNGYYGYITAQILGFTLGYQGIML